MSNCWLSDVNIRLLVPIKSYEKNDLTMNNMFMRMFSGLFLVVKVQITFPVLTNCTSVRLEVDLPGLL